MSERGTVDGSTGGMLRVDGRQSVPATVAAIEDAARDAGMTIFGRVDHAAAARDADLELPDEVVILLGSPKVGTALMQADARAGLDLPLRVLVFDDNGTTRIVWRDPRGLAGQHELEPVEPVLEKMAAGLRKVIDAVS